MRPNTERVRELLRVSREHAMLAADPDLAADLLDVDDESASSICCASCGPGCGGGWSSACNVAPAWAA